MYIYILYHHVDLQCLSGGSPGGGGEMAGGTLLLYRQSGHQDLQPGMIRAFTLLCNIHAIMGVGLHIASGLHADWCTTELMLCCILSYLCTCKLTCSMCSYTSCVIATCVNVHVHLVICRSPSCTPLWCSGWCNCYWLSLGPPPRMRGRGRG